MKTLHVLDTETHLIQPGLAAPPIVCFSHASDSEPNGKVLTPDDGMALLKRILIDPEAALGNTNLVYDLGNAVVRDPSFVPLVFAALEQPGKLLDTSIFEKLHSIATTEKQDDSKEDSYSQEAMERLYLSVDRAAEKKDGWRMRYSELDGVPLHEWPAAALDYPKADARGALSLLKIQLSDGRENQQCITQEMRAAWVLHLAKIWGIRTDPALVRSVTERIHRLHENSRDTFFTHGIVRVRPCTKKEGVYEPADSYLTPQWLVYHQAALDGACEWHARRAKDFEKCLRAIEDGKPVRFAVDKGVLQSLVSEAYNGNPPLTPSGEVSTSRDTLEESGNRLLEEYAATGENEKFLSAFVPLLEQGTSVPINASFDTPKATQRTSYFKPNLQQIPQNGTIRECFVARPGKVFVSCDYSALEMATAAQACLNMGIDSQMAKLINQGVDLHVLLGSQFLNIPYEQGVALHKSKDPHFKGIRKAAKPVNFGKGGLMGAPKMVITARKQGVVFCESVGRVQDGQCYSNGRITHYKSRTIPPTCPVCLEVAEGLCDSYYKIYPCMRRYHELTVRASKDAIIGVPMTSFGTGLRRLSTNASACSNHYFQNLAAQGAKHAAWLLSYAQYNDPSSVLFNRSRLIIFIHDETICEVDEEYLHECGYEQARIGVAGMKEFVPDVTIKMEPAACRRWFKSADTVHDKNGRLKPWWPSDWGWEPDLEQMRKDVEA